MAKYERNAGKPWTPKEVSQLRELAKGNTPTRVISFKLGRPVGGVQNKTSEKNISLKPTNQRPYGTK